MNLRFFIIIIDKLLFLFSQIKPNQTSLRRDLRNRLPFLRPGSNSCSLVLRPQLRRDVVDRRVELRDPVREVLLRHRLPRAAAPVAAALLVEEARQLEPALVVGQQRRADLRGEEEAQGAEDDAAEDKSGGKAAGAVAALGAGRALRRAVRGFQEGKKEGTLMSVEGRRSREEGPARKHREKNNRVRLLSLLTPIINAKLTARRELSMRSWSNDAGKTACPRQGTDGGGAAAASGERRRRQRR